MVDVDVDEESKQLLSNSKRIATQYSSFDSNSEKAPVLNVLEEKQRGKKQRWLTIVFGQIIALLATSSNASSFTLEYGMGKVFPAFLMFIVYSILSLYLFFRPVMEDDTAYRIPRTPIKLRAPWWQYVFLSAFDILPNYCTLISLQLTTLTSATLLGSLTVPSTMLVCHFILKKKYLMAHYIGAMLCLIGGAILILADFNHSTNLISSPSHPKSYFGDILAVLAAILYGIGDAASEYWTKHVDRKEYLGMIGFHGAIVSFLLFLIYEWDAVYDAVTDTDGLMIIICAIWYISSVVLFYVLATLFLVSSDATLLILSLQASNLWAVLFSFVAFGENPSSLFYFAVTFVAAGVSVYELLGNKFQESAKELRAYDDYLL